MTPRVLIALAGALLLAVPIVAQPGPSLVVTGCNNPAARPQAVRAMRIVINRFGDGGKVHWRPPTGACVAYYEVRIVENGPSPRIIGGGPVQTSDLSMQMRGLTPGREYLITVTAFNARGAGPGEAQTVTPIKSTDCDRVPAAVREVSITADDSEALTAAWTPGDGCYESAEVLAFDAASNAVVYRGSTVDTVTRIPGLRPKTQYRVQVTPMSSNRRGPSATASGRTACNAAEVPGSAVGLSTQALSPAGTVVLSMRGVSNSACVRDWEVLVRGEGQSRTSTVKPTDPITGAASFRFVGRPNGRYTFSAVAISPSGRRGITSNIGPVLADGRTVLEVGPR